MVDDEIRAWNLTPHSGVWFFTNLPSGIPSPSSDPRRLHTHFSPFQPLSQSRTDLTSLTKDQRQKALPRTLSCLL
ncbi:hypothetical protein GEV33_000762 [Tenebrio molitor]|uniref:Uncharacterized protein n=1 Tax=Tenebrio molitor TaxID=7067 RepID=A0A8J6HWB5_TENMO|nr:hypothetical protein GEV33_000762 [Tenebrio molitor]